MARDFTDRGLLKTFSCRVVDVLYRSLETALIRQCAQRYGVGVALRPARVSEDGTTMQLQILCRGRVRETVQLEVNHVGGNVYDVICAVEGGDSRQFVYCISANDGDALPQAPTLGRRVATFVLEELEKQLGRKLLRRQVHSSMRLSSSSRKREEIGGREG